MICQICYNFILNQTPSALQPRYTIIINFIDRTLPLSSPYLQKNDSGTYYHQNRNPKKQQFIIVANSGFPGEETFTNLKYIFKQFKPIAEIYRSSGEILRGKNPHWNESIEQYLINLKEAGSEIVLNNNISPLTIELLKQDLVSVEGYVQNANQYWRHQLSQGAIE